MTVRVSRPHLSIFPFFRPSTFPFSIFPSFHFPSFPLAIWIAMLVLPTMLQGQQDSFVPERPGQTWSTEVAAPGYVHFEAGVLMQRAGFTPESADGALAGGEVYSHTLWQLPAMMLRVGLTDHVEFRLATKYKRLSWRLDPGYFHAGAGDDPIEEARNSGMDVVNVGIKTVITQADGWIPRSAFIATIGIPSLASGIYDIAQPAPDLALGFSHTLADNLSLGYSGGLSWDGWTAVPMGYASAMLAMDLDARMSLFMEYGIEAYSHAPVLHTADAGLVYTVSDDFILDAWAGFGLGDPEISSAAPHYTSIYRPDLFVGAGAAYRLRL